MSDEQCTVVRDSRPEDRDAAIQVLAASFQGFGPVDQVVGDDDKAQDRRRSMFGMTFKEGTKQNVIVAERDGRIEGVLTYADRPDCIPSARDSLAAVRRTPQSPLTSRPTNPNSRSPRVAPSRLAARSTRGRA